MCCSVLQYFVVCSAKSGVVFTCVAVCCSVLQCVAVCSAKSGVVFTCVAVCCSLLQCVAGCSREVHGVTNDERRRQCGRLVDF